MKTLILTTLLALPGLLTNEAFGQWIKPYATGSADDHLIRFDQGSTGTVTAPDPPHGIGYTYSAIPAFGVGAGWNLMATGSVGHGNLSNFDGQSNAASSAGGENLRFGTDTDKSNNLLGANLPMLWSGNATIPGSPGWVTATNHFRYNFDLSLDHHLVDDYASIYDGFNLTITAGANVLYTGIGLEQILGVGVIDQNMYKDNFVSFDYNQADGPLTITWSGSALMTGAMIDDLGNGTKDILRVHKTSITTEAIPEPGTVALLSSSLLLSAIGLHRRRQSAGF